MQKTKHGMSAHGYFVDDNVPFYCARCSARTTRRESLGMLQCTYHPHLHGPLTPMPGDNEFKYVDVHPRSSAGKCKPCALTYTGKHHAYVTIEQDAAGCTSIDHLEPHRALHEFLMREPYEVMPMSRWSCGKTNYAAAQPSQISVVRRKRGVHGPATVLRIVNASQVHCERSGLSAHMRILLHAPRAEHCGVADERVRKAFDAGILLSLEELYNESADKYGYARMNESAWRTTVLNANKHILSTGESDADEGYAMLTADQICEAEMYADTHRVEQFTSFVPFVVVLRVEPHEVRIEMK